MEKLILSAIRRSKREAPIFESATSLSETSEKNPVLEVPINPEQTSWKTVSTYEKNSLQKVYKFTNSKHLRYFVDEMLKESDQIFHHPKLIIEGLNVKVELYTHDINDVSDLDIHLSKFADEIFREVSIVLGV
jgi:pterin-4a-carbinolamine dehydratase